MKKVVLFLVSVLPMISFADTFSEAREYRHDFYASQEECEVAQTGDIWFNCFQSLELRPDGSGSLMLTDIMNSVTYDIDRSSNTLIVSANDSAEVDQMVFQLSADSNSLVDEHENTWVRYREASLKPNGICTKDINQWGNASACQCTTDYQYNNISGMCELGGLTVLEPAGICTKDFNEWGYPSICECPEGYQYTQEKGLCELDTRPASLDPAGICTMDINPWGNASICNCPEDYSYNQISGMCELGKPTVLEPKGICTMDINEWGHSSLCQCPEDYSYDQKLGLCKL